MAADSERKSGGASTARWKRARPADDRWLHRWFELFNANLQGPDAFQQAFEENERLLAEPFVDREVDDRAFLVAHSEPVENPDLFDRPRRQPYFFAHQFLPARVSESPRYLLDQLRSEASTRYLKVQWILSTLPLSLERSEMADGEEIQCFAVDIRDNCHAAVVRMPLPERVTEAYYVAVVVNSHGNPEYRYYTLELAADRYGKKTTILGRWMGPSGDVRMNVGPGPVPLFESFLAVVSDLSCSESR